MPDVTKDWTGGEPLVATGDPTTPAADTTELVPDSGDRASPASTAAAETRSFSEGAPRSAKSRAGTQSGKTTARSAFGITGQDETLLRASLETIRIKADELRGQARGWAEVRREQARLAIDERPITAVAAAFGAGLVLGALLSR